MATGVECREANDTLSIGEGKLIMRWTLEVNGMTMTVINVVFLTGCAMLRDLVYWGRERNRERDRERSKEGESS